MRRNTSASLHIDQALRTGESGGCACAVDTRGIELRVGDVGRCRHEVAHIDLATTAKHHAVGIDDHDGTIAFDLPLYLAGTRLRIVHTIEHRPACLRAAHAVGVVGCLV